MGSRFSRNKDTNKGSPTKGFSTEQHRPEHLPPHEHRLNATAADPSAWCLPPPLCHLPDLGALVRELAPEVIQFSADQLFLQVLFSWFSQLSQWRALAMLRAASRRMHALVAEALPVTGWPQLGQPYIWTPSMCGGIYLWMTPHVYPSPAVRGNEHAEVSVLVSSNGYCGRTSFMNVCAGGERTLYHSTNQIGLGFKRAKPLEPKFGYPAPIAIQLVRSSAWQLQYDSSELSERMTYRVATNGSGSQIYARILQFVHFVVTDREFRDSFDQIVRISDCVAEIEQENPPSVPCCVAVLVGTMADCESSRKVSTAEGLAMAESIRMPYFECSASTGPGGVDEVWRIITSCLENAMICQRAQASESSG